MEVLQAIMELYSAIPLDATLRDGRLKKIIKRFPKELAIFEAIGSILPASPKSYLIPEPVDQTIIEYLLDTSVVENVPPEAYVVLRAIYKKTFKSATFIKYLPRMYTRIDALKLLENISNPKDKFVYYFVSSNPLDYTYATKTRVFSSINYKSGRPIVDKGTCLITSKQHEVVATGGKKLFDYIVKGKPIDSLGYFNKLPKILEKDIDSLSKFKGKYVNVFGETFRSFFVPEDRYEVIPYDWKINSNYEPVGFKFEIGGKHYEKSYKIKTKWLDKGLDNLKLVVDKSYGSKLKIAEIIILNAN